MNASIEIPKDEIAAFCQRNRIRRMALFGSVLRDDFGPESDVDVLDEVDLDKLCDIVRNHLPPLIGRREGT